MFNYNGIDCDLYSSDAAMHSLVLVHGLGASSQQFADLVEIASDRLRLICVNLPGHGENICDPNSRPASFADFRDALISLCDHLGIQKAVFAGISMGSALSLMVAARRSDLCSAVIAIRPAWLTEANPCNLHLIGHIGARLSEDSVEEVRTEIEAHPDFKSIARDVPLAAASILAAIDRPHAKAHAPVLSAMTADAPFQRVTDLREVTCPICVVGTNADALHPVEIARQTANALPNARLEFLPPRYLEPQAHAAALKRLIQDIVALNIGETHDYQAS